MICGVNGRRRLHRRKGIPIGEWAGAAVFRDARGMVSLVRGGIVLIGGAGNDGRCIHIPLIAVEGRAAQRIIPAFAEHLIIFSYCHF